MHNPAQPPSDPASSRPDPGNPKRCDDNNWKLALILATIFAGENGARIWDAAMHLLQWTLHLTIAWAS
jgi:hypothetical protein